MEHQAHQPEILAKKSYEVECARAWYATSVLEQATKDSFLELNEIKFG